MIRGHFYWLGERYHVYPLVENSQRTLIIIEIHLKKGGAL